MTNEHTYLLTAILKHTDTVDKSPPSICSGLKAVKILQECNSELNDFFFFSDMKHYRKRNERYFGRIEFYF